MSYLLECWLSRNIIFSAENFDDFLTHAEEYFNQSKPMEAGVLASVVFEDTLKKLAKKHAKTADPLIDELVKAGVFNQPKAKQLKGNASTRNFALHADWANLTLADVGELIRGVRSLLTDYL